MHGTVSKPQFNKSMYVLRVNSFMTLFFYNSIANDNAYSNHVHQYNIRFKHADIAMRNICIALKFKLSLENTCVAAINLCSKISFPAFMSAQIKRKITNKLIFFC